MRPLAARPDCWWSGDRRLRKVSGFVQCIAACEHILLPPPDDRGDETITGTFGIHGATLCPEESIPHPDTAARLSSLYSLRSRLIHGRMGLEDLDARQTAALDEGRQLLGKVILSALSRMDAVPDGVLLSTWLASQSTAAANNSEDDE